MERSGFAEAEKEGGIVSQLSVWLCEAIGVCVTQCIRFDAIIKDYIMENYS